MSKKTYDDDDGRVIADMSDLDRQPMLLPRFRRKKEAPDPDAQQMSKEDRMVIIKSAIGASLLIGGSLASDRRDLHRCRSTGHLDHDHGIIKPCIKPRRAAVFCAAARRFVL